MTWTVMRRDVDRDVRVAACATETEAGARLRETRLLHPDEDAWIEGDSGAADVPRSEPVMLVEPIPHDTSIRDTPTRIPEARVVSPLVRAKPRRIPWLATIYMIGPTTASVAAVLLAAAIICLPGRDGHSLHLVSTQVEAALEHVGGVWMMLAGLLIAARATYERAFLRRAQLIEGVMTNGTIETTIDGTTYRLESIAPDVPEGTRVPLFWHGSRVVELCKAGARIDPSGEVTWDAKAYPYRSSLFRWPVTFAVAVVVLIATLVVAFS